MTLLPPWTHRLSALLLACALIASACGDGDDTTASSASESSSSASASASEPSASAPDDGDADADASEPADDAESDAEPAGEPVTATVTDVIGEKTVPVTDENIYALDELTGTLLLTLDVEPTTTAAFFQDPLLAPLLEANTTLVEAGSVEAIAAERPSLLLGIGHPIFIESLDDYTAVAPTVLPDFTSPWSDQTRLFAQVVGREAEAEAVISTIEQRIADLKAEIDAAGLSGQQVAIVQDFGGDWFAYGPTSISGTVIEQLGFTRSPAQSGSENSGFLPLSAEVIPDETNVPWVFGVRSTSDGGDPTATVLDDPLVGGADSVVADVGEAWFNNSALGAWIVMDDLEAVLFGRGEVTELDGATAAFADLLAAVEAQG